MANHDQYDYVEVTRDVATADTLLDSDSKYSAERSSPMDPMDKGAFMPPEKIEGRA